MYLLRFSTVAKRRLKKLNKSGHFPQKQRLGAALALLTKRTELPAEYKDHALHGKLRDVREFHIGFDFVVLHKRNDELRTITVADLGTHVEVFGD